MTIVGFTFTKFSVEKKPLVSKEVKLSNDLQLTNVEVVPRSDRSADVLKFSFTFNVLYGDVGNINLVGYLLYADEVEKLKKLEEAWQKDKMVPAVLFQQVMNAVLVKCNVKALELAQDVGLPPHFELPKLSVNKLGKKK